MTRVTWDYIAGFFDGEGSVSTMNFTHRDTLAGTIVTLSQTGQEGLVILTAIREFLAGHGIKGYVCSRIRRAPYRQMHHLKVSARPSVRSLLWHLLPRVSVKRVVVADTLRFIIAFPSVREATTANRNRERGKYGSLNLNADELRTDLAAGMSLTKLAAKHSTTTYTIHKYLDPDYRQRYNAYRKKWRANQVVKAKASAA